MRQPRRFEDLRARDGVIEAVRADGIDAAMQRIGLTDDGRHMIAWLKCEMRRGAVVGASDATLREAEGARRAYERLLDMADANEGVR